MIHANNPTATSNRHMFPEVYIFYDGFLNNFKIFERNGATLSLIKEGGEMDGI